MFVQFWQLITRCVNSSRLSAWWSLRLFQLLPLVIIHERGWGGARFASSWNDSRWTFGNRRPSRLDHHNPGWQHNFQHNKCGDFSSTISYIYFFTLFFTRFALISGRRFACTTSAATFFASSSSPPKNRTRTDTQTQTQPHGRARTHTLTAKGERGEGKKR